MAFSYRDQSFHFDRYPSSDNRSLRAWNAGDEYLLQRLADIELHDKTIAIYNDRFGFISSVLQVHRPYSIIQYASQKKAFKLNFEKNHLTLDDDLLLTPLKDFPKSIDLACIKIPKSTELFELFLSHLMPFLPKDGLVICSFMTRHFNKKMMTIAANYFEEVEQSKAWKKSRLLLLKNKKKTLPPSNLIKSIELDKNHVLKQYPGVFSGKQVDIATRFLLENLSLESSELNLLDLGAGNGVIAYHLRQQSKASKIHLLDDNYLAIASSQLNLTDQNTTFLWSDSMEHYPDSTFDLIACNPPFHFEYENTIEIALSLFKATRRCLKPGGRFVLVANLHLNYKTHLEKLFSQVEVLASNERFVVYECKYFARFLT